MQGIYFFIFASCEPLSDVHKEVYGGNFTFMPICHHTLLLLYHQILSFSGSAKKFLLHVKPFFFFFFLRELNIMRSFMSSDSKYVHS